MPEHFEYKVVDMNGQDLGGFVVELRQARGPRRVQSLTVISNSLPYSLGNAIQSYSEESFDILLLDLAKRLNNKFITGYEGVTIQHLNGLPAS